MKSYISSPLCSQPLNQLLLCHQHACSEPSLTGIPIGDLLNESILNKQNKLGPCSLWTYVFVVRFWTVTQFEKNDKHFKVWAIQSKISKFGSNSFIVTGSGLDAKIKTWNLDYNRRKIWKAQQFKPFQGSQLGERSEVHDTEHGISTSVYQEADYCSQDENLILQHELPAQVDSLSILEFGNSSKKPQKVVFDNQNSCKYNVFLY